ncbi:hypothetical protein Pcinc_025941 [Petrolisthes cinctipes]|uniref:Uncharacterized protein n=1 Tax=Petrolisthes cinctipes TaxID=88211 RepID=A0AAE1F899_PETCI|nr:hypothetical protein Pcinc_025941 [Petrolisthes cinctipes]
MFQFELSYVFLDSILKKMEGNVPPSSPTSPDLPPSYEEATSQNHQNQFSSKQQHLQQSLSQHFNPPPAYTHPSAPPTIQPTVPAGPSRAAPNLNQNDGQLRVYQVYSGTTSADTRVLLPSSHRRSVSTWKRVVTVLAGLIIICLFIIFIIFQRFYR